MPQVTEEQFHSNGPWECFHCGEVFTTPGAAADHFGAEMGSTPGCLIEYRVALEEGGKPERGRGLLMELRKAEERCRTLSKLYEEAENDAELAQGALSSLKRKIGELIRPGRTVERLVELFHATNPEHGGHVFNCKHWPCVWMHSFHQFTETREENVEPRMRDLCIICGHPESHTVHVKEDVYATR